MGGGETRSLGGSDPSLSGLAAAQRHGRRGSLPPKSVQHTSLLRRQQSWVTTPQSGCIDQAIEKKVVPRANHKAK